MTNSALTVQFETSGTPGFYVDILALTITGLQYQSCQPSHVQGTFNNTPPVPTPTILTPPPNSGVPPLRPAHWIPPLGLTWQWPVVGTDMSSSNIFGRVVIQDLFASKQVHSSLLLLVLVSLVFVLFILLYLC